MSTARDEGVDKALRETLAEASTRMPSYYDTGFVDKATGEPIDVIDLVERRWPDSDNFCEKDVLKYLFRAGAKPDVPAARDWLKIVRVALRKYRKLGGVVPNDL